MKRRACVIGLGSMGYGAAASLLRAGFEVRGVDVRDDVLERFAREGGRAERSAAAGAREAEAVLTFVVNAAQTEAVLFGDDGAAAALARGAVVIACATVPPLEAERLAMRISAQALLALDAPVSGGPIKAAEGALTVMGSGSAAAFDKAEPFLKAIAAKVYRLGDKPGIGSRVKMVNQLLAGVHIAAAAEAMALGMRAGLDPQQLFEVISDSAGSSCSRTGCHISWRATTPRARPSTSGRRIWASCWRPPRHWALRRPWRPPPTSSSPRPRHVASAARTMRPW